LNVRTAISRPVLDRWPLFVLLPLAAWFVWAAGHYTVFDDEGFSCLRYTMPLGEMVRGLWNGVEPDPPLYYILENLWVRVVGVGPLGLRSLSILLFLAGLVMMRRAAAAWFDERVANLTLILCAIHPAHLFFGFAARWYSCMFLCVAALLWVTGLWHRRAAGGDAARRRAPPYLLWSLCAAAVCYTNYFGPIVVGLVWLAVSSRADDKRPWGWAALGTILLYAPWLPAFWQQATTFPQVGGAPSAYAATAARTAMALLAGNLAGPRTWWVWLPMAIFCAALIALLVRQRVGVWPLALIVTGCLAAGVASRTMIDKYVMAFSGPACCLAAALLVGAAAASARSLRRLRLVAANSLAIAWIGCGVNLVTERHWSSLRWLDPWEPVVASWLDHPGAPPPSNWIISHPAGRYYIARLMAERTSAPESQRALRRVEPQAWRRWAGASLVRANWPDCPPYTEESFIQAFRSSSLQIADSQLLSSDRAMRRHLLLSIEAASLENPAASRMLRWILQESADHIDERSYLADPDAQLKDRLDPAYKHPRHRITVRLWRLRAGRS